LLTCTPTALAHTQASFFNHSCAANCEVAYGPVDILTVTTNCAVAKGDELTISYIDQSLDTTARLEELATDYKFACICPECQ
jgi:SET domain-containing protein